MELHMLFLSSILTISFFIATFPISHCQQDEGYPWCQNLFNCGAVKDIGYPFWSESDYHHPQRPRHCGSDGFELFCHDNQIPSIQFDSQKFNIVSIDQSAYNITVVRADLISDPCSSNLTNISFGKQSNVFHYESNVENLTLFYHCPQQISTGQKAQNKFSCQSQTGSGLVFYGNDTQLQRLFSELEQCERRIQVPISGSIGLDPGGDIDTLLKALNKGFNLKYSVESGCSNCMESEGACGSGIDGKFTCHCQDGSHPTNCPHSKGPSINVRNKVIVGVGCSTVSVILVFVVLYFYRRRKKNGYAKSYIQSRATSSDSSIVVELENGSKYYGVPIFSYDELEEATNYFDSARELGDGGFGTVYFGKLRDGRHVAVKRLYENNYKRVEQFMNEVEILTRLRHKNLVSLYGCTSRHSRELLLVYEYIPNGTVADHLHGDRAKPGTPPWNIRMSIAIETASALAYLHASDVIHRDVKTNNILLDEHFCVKVADFGLSRLFPDHVTHVSTAPQGTPGYVDPEYHECYQLTDKSDVYSFGVVLIELISSMPAVDITRHRHEINLSTMAINKIQSRALHELVDPSLGFETDYRVRKMINAVAELAFQCLQSMKDMRPSMKEVLDALMDIESDGKHKSKPEVMDIADDVVLLESDLPSPSLDSNSASKSTTPNDSK